MNLLPKTSDEFATKDYWNQFFQKRGKLAFDWYGEFPELCGILSKYIKTTDIILNVGCGNSKLTIDMHKIGFKDITNIDLSEVVINQMKNTYKECKWIQMDATEMTFENEQFTVIIDKGTLDAMMSEKTESKVVDKYFCEVKRILKRGGRFVLVSLLQDHIVEALIKFFPANDFLVRVIRCYEAEQKTANSNEDKASMPVFVVVATKFSKLPNRIFEILNDGETIERLPDENSLVTNILNIQRAAIIKNSLVKKKFIEDEISFDVYKGNEIRYSLYILDQKSTRNLNEYAAFIVPQGRETEWLFATKQGRRKLLESAQHSRLSVIIMHRNQTYASLDTIKLEINETIKTFAPKGIKDMSKIPFLSLGNDIGVRNIVFKGHSSLSGDFVVEDVISENNKTFRRLIFLNNQFIIQSEALLKRGKQQKIMIDHSYLSCQHHLYMVLGVLVAQCENNLQNLIIGLGGGGLLMYIYNFIKNVAMTVVEIDHEIVRVAKEYFGLFEDTNRLKVIVDDGLKYLNSEIQTKYQSILFDIDSKDQSVGISCPPKEFLTKEILNRIKNLLSSNGVFVLNFVCRDEALRVDMIHNISEIFQFIISFKLDEDINEIFFCFKDKFEDYKDRFKKAAKKLNIIKRETIDLNDLFDNLKIIGN